MKISTAQRRRTATGWQGVHSVLINCIDDAFYINATIIAIDSNDSMIKLSSLILKKIRLLFHIYVLILLLNFL